LFAHAGLKLLRHSMISGIDVSNAVFFRVFQGGVMAAPGFLSLPL
jgi:hypothetical protein